MGSLEKLNSYSSQLIKKYAEKNDDKIKEIENGLNILIVIE
jgi:hypothetical protein